MRTSFHINTMWHHVNWGKDGRVGKDQHGQWWYNIASPRDEDGRRPIKIDWMDDEAKHFIENKRRAA